MTLLQIRIAMAALVVAVWILLFWAISSWDNGRLKAAYDRGVATERQAWVDKQNAASAAQAAKNAADSRTSEAAADSARAGAQAALDTNAAIAATATEEISRAHVQAKTPVCNPGPDGRARQLPRGVLDALAKARSSAVGEAGAAAR